MTDSFGYRVTWSSSSKLNLNADCFDRCFLWNPFLPEPQPVHPTGNCTKACALACIQTLSREIRIIQSNCKRILQVPWFCGYSPGVVHVGGGCYLRSFFFNRPCPNRYQGI
eukprot:5117065-Karenia_brevis.AAC.2